MVEWLMAPDCKFGSRKRYAGSNPARPTISPDVATRALHNGSASAFQADSASSILAARSKPPPVWHPGSIPSYVKRDTKRIGTISELMVMAALAHKGYRLLVPYGDSARYDVVIEDEAGSFSKVQIKTGRLKNGAIVFNGYSAHSHRGRTSTRLYSGEVEFFGVYCPQVGRCYLVPAEEVRSEGSLRIEATYNGQAKNVRWAAKYELPAPSLEKVVGASGAHVVRFPLA